MSRMAGPPNSTADCQSSLVDNWALETVWRLEEKSFFLCRGSNLDHHFIQLVARHYTDWATRFTIRGDEYGKRIRTKRLKVSLFVVKTAKSSVEANSMWHDVGGHVLYVVCYSNPPFNAPNSFRKNGALRKRLISVRICINLVTSVRSVELFP
jgi:hypothetical protein